MTNDKKDFVPCADSIEPSDDIIYEAYVWLVRLTSGEATEEDLQKFLTWRDASDENLIAISKATILWNALGSLDAKPKDDLDTDDEKPALSGLSLNFLIQ